MIYAFVGSLFDADCLQVDHHNILGQMPELERNTATFVMQNLVRQPHPSAQTIAHLHFALESGPFPSYAERLLYC